MRTQLLNCLLAGSLLTVIPGAARGQGMFGGPPSAPSFGGAMAKLFGENSSFSADIELSTKLSESPMQMQGKVACLDGKSRFETDMGKIASSRMPPGMAAQMQSMGLSQMVMISRPDKSYLVYPNLKAYVELPTPDADAAKTADGFKMETTELGKETVDGHPCVKNKAVVTDSQSKTNEFTMWNATDLRHFPIKIEVSAGGDEKAGGAPVSSTFLFKQVQFTKPETGAFSPPDDFTKYDNMMSLMQTEMTKRMRQHAPGGP